MIENGSSRQADAVAIAALLAVTALYAVVFADFSASPFEDGAMLLRYAQHFSQGHGLVWNIGEPPVDGATDLLFTILVGGIASTGVAVHHAARAVSVAAHLATLLLVYGVLRRTQRAPLPAAFFTAIVVAVGPGLALSAACFGTPLFVLLTALAWTTVLRLLTPAGSTRVWAAAFGVMAVIMGIARPEGVLIAGFMAVTLALSIEPARRRHVLTTAVGVFAILGGAYFAWRWNYFANPLPNPYYKKGGGRLHPEGLWNAVKNTAEFTYPFLWPFPLALAAPRATRMALAFAVPIAGSTLMWVLLSDEMNFGGRFQYPVMAMAALSWYPLACALLSNKSIARRADTLRARRLAIPLATSLIAAVVLVVAVVRRPQPPAFDGRESVGRALAAFADRGHALVTTEAGLVPLYSRWRTLDAWGLNDRWIARHGGVTRERIAEFSPTVCMVHKIVRQTGPGDSEWDRSAAVVEAYAIERGFRLAAAYGHPPDDAHYYYVRMGLVDSDAIVAAIQRAPYAW